MAVRLQVEEEYILALSDFSARDATLAGAKAANEAALLQAGFPVPDGFILSTSAFTSFLVANKLTSDSTPELITAAPVPAEILKALNAGLADLGNGPLAVRSSAVAEDLPGASFAGQYETILNVQGIEELQAAVRHCWASVFSEHVVAYRERQGLETSPMAVLIQRLIQADAAGVAFTANPVSGDKSELVISAVRGLGERLVSGEASPDEWIVRDRDPQRHAAPEEAITTEQALEIAEMARKVESHFGQPQDIEWARADGNLYVLQARPITTLPDESSSSVEMIPIPVEVPPGFWEHDASHFPEPIYPMNRLAYDPAKVAVEGWVDDFGYLFEGLEFREIGGWVYNRIVPLGGKEGPPLPKPLIWLLVRTVPYIRRRIRQAIDTIRTDKPDRYVRQWYAQHQPELANRITELQEIDLTNLSDEELSQHIDSTISLLYRGLEVHTYAHGSLAIILYKLATTCEDLLGWDATKTFSLVEGTSFKSTEPARRLHALAQMAQASPAVLMLLDDIDEGVMDNLEKADPEFAQAFAAYLKKYGGRVLNEISEQTIAETPNLLLGQIHSQILRGYDPQADQAALAQKREAAAVEARTQLADRSADLARFEEVLEQAKLAYPVREDNHFFTGSAPMALIRYAILEMAERLVTRGVIDHRDDIFFLELEEARLELLNTAPHTADVNHKELVQKRKGERAWALANPGPPSYGEEPGPPPDMSFLPPEARLPMEAMLWSLETMMAPERSNQNQQADSALTGIAASAGEYTGPVRVIMNEGEFDKLQPGDVLVCPITSPVWSVLFPSVGALVTESGGILSHPAIIAREYRVPAVVATGNATSLLKDGQIVRVDGSTGLVEPVSPVGEDEQVIMPIPIPAEPPPGYWVRNADHQPLPTTPMNNSVFREHQRIGAKRMFDDYGLLIDRIDIQDIGGWEYFRMVPLGGSDGPDLPKWLMWLLVRSVPMIRRRMKISEEAIRTDKPGRLVQRWYDEYRPELVGLIDELRQVDLDQLSDSELEDHFEAINALFGKTFHEVGPVRHLSCAFILYDLVKTCRELLDWDERKTFDLLIGTSYKSLEPSRRLNELTQMAKERSTVQKLLEEIDDDSIDRLRAADEEFASALDNYLEEYGHRALRYEVADPTLAETPELVLKLIRGQIATGYDPTASEARLSQRRTETAAQARAHLNGRPIDLARFDRVLKRAKMAYPIREDNEFYCVSIPMALLRYAVLELGKRLTKRGVLEHRDDVFFLNLSEARSALQGGGDLLEVVRRRQGENAWAQANPGPPSFGQEPGSPLSLDFLPAEARLAMEVVMWYFDPEGEADTPTRTNQSSSNLTGTAVSPGEYTGPARVIMHEGEFHKLQPGDVLVCPTTSPVWSVLFPSIGALVADTGGMLSHPAIIAREYQIPAVVALGNGTSLLKDGQMVTVNGSSGTVDVLHQ